MERVNLHCKEWPFCGHRVLLQIREELRLDIQDEMVETRFKIYDAFQMIDVRTLQDWKNACELLADYLIELLE
jgi:hypothetical protein